MNTILKKDTKKKSTNAQALNGLTIGSIGNVEMNDFQKIFQEKFNRPPTSQDLRNIIAGLPVTVDSDPSFNTTLSEIQELNGLEKKQVEDAIIKAAKEDQNRDKLEVERKESRRKFWDFSLRWLVFSGILAIAGGIGVATYLATQNFAVKEVKSFYEKKTEGLSAKEVSLQENHAVLRKELEDKFFGKLDNLLEPAAVSSLSDLERELYCVSSFKDPFMGEMQNNKNIICNKAFEKGKIIGRLMSVAYQRPGYSPDIVNYLVIEKHDDKNMVALYVYTTKKLEMGEIGTATPDTFIIFSGNQVRKINYEHKEIKLIENNKNIFKGNQGYDLYEKLAKDILIEFQAFYGRGPN
jgi:hypothetical protein